MIPSQLRPYREDKPDLHPPTSSEIPEYCKLQVVRPGSVRSASINCAVNPRWTGAKDAGKLLHDSTPEVAQAGGGEKKKETERERKGNSPVENPGVTVMYKAIKSLPPSRRPDFAFCLLPPHQPCYFSESYTFHHVR